MLNGVFSGSRLSCYSAKLFILSLTVKNYFWKDRSSFVLNCLYPVAYMFFGAKNKFIIQFLFQ